MVRKLAFRKQWHYHIVAKKLLGQQNRGQGGGVAPVSRARDAITVGQTRELVYTGFLTSLPNTQQFLSIFETKSVWKNFEIHSVRLLIYPICKSVHAGR
jgi:hypothetical protein